MPEDEVLQRFIAMQPDVPEALRSCYGIAYLVQDLAFVEALLAGPRPPRRACASASKRSAWRRPSTTRRAPARRCDVRPTVLGDPTDGASQTSR